MKIFSVLSLFAILGAYKVTRTLIDGGTLWVASGWLLAGVWFFWIAWAYLNNKDLPAAGALRYEAGANQIARSAYFLVMTGLFLYLMLRT